MNFLTRLFTVDGTRLTVRGLCRLPTVNCQLLLLLLLLPLWAVAQNGGGKLFPDKPEPAVYVHDYAGWLQPYQKNVLEQKLRGYWDSTSTQIVVMIRPDIGDYDKASYAFELGNQWGIGRKDKDNGVVVLIKTEPPERGIFIATGAGTEGALPDITAGRIIRNTMGPYFRQQQYFEGINAGLDDIIRALQGEFQREPTDGKRAGGRVGLLVMLFILLFFGFVIWGMVMNFRKGGKWITHDGTDPRRRNRRDDDNFGGGWWIGGGGGGSGWGGGGESG